MFLTRLPLRRYGVCIGSKFHYTTQTTPPSPSNLGFVFDIDGVLLKGSTAIPNASETLTKLTSLKIPFILLTNGGGQLEKDRCEYISSKLQLSTKLNERQLVQSHTPFKTLINDFKRVLIVGGPNDSSRQVGYDYGFEQVLRPIDLIKANGKIWPFHKYTKLEINEWSIPVHESKVDVTNPNPKMNEKIDAIFVFNDPRDMGSDLQIILDLLNSQDGLLGTSRIGIPNVDYNKPSIPIIFSNNDFLWSNEFQLPRFGQGAFKIQVESIYKHITNCNLHSLSLGKPYKVSYDYAHHVLIDWRSQLVDGINNTCLPELNKTPLNSPFNKIYMVGDNPESDILGGNNYGWETILVKTGVYKDGDFEINRKLSKPTVGVFDDVKDGVFKVLKDNNLI
ncbi:hypothetical protein CANARDRAFT_26404 [[Candida] arabinofermentans NRRL YB-2248]|uniref:TIGR01456 family HAD hydrolase n=1 Tax=[Candida] arabinofermentans NRRL YB-2248 TaxID=983967 RepID=A0A1E4T920_9ASCO|nr:hypothetical protein CANARDRAFT_26404 [[Candida] arabinofermentans NRRL YB-2248]